tara:strand:- start:641 stop:1372 length:732 start_codon:yes stop_codon:yes gene_type:complete
MKYLSFMLVLLGAFFSSATVMASGAPGAASVHRTIEISSQFSEIETNVRGAAVRVVTSDGGHGSGSLVQYKDMQLVITAQHVTSEIIGTVYRVIRGTELKMAVLVYSNENRDHAILWVTEPYDEGAIRWDPGKTLAPVGQRITYSGYPGAHNLMTFRGRVAGFETMGDGSTNILLHTYGYFGCSGSLVYSDAGEVVGILWGIDVNRGVPVESMVWVSPIQNLNMPLALRSICRSLDDGPRACR